MEKHLSKTRPRLDRVIQLWEHTQESLYDYLNDESRSTIYASTRNKLYDLRDELKEAYLACNQLLAENEDTKSVYAHSRKGLL